MFLKVYKLQKVLYTLYSEATKNKMNECILLIVFVRGVEIRGYEL